MVKLVLVRHGESTANFDNTYTGWSDVNLTETGRKQAHVAGQLIAASGIEFNAVHTSLLRRAIITAYVIQDELGDLWLPIHKSWRLNERHYGALRGLNKDHTRVLFGKDQVARWRRSYTAEPPHLVRAHHQRRYARFPSTIIPTGESLADASARLLPYWNDVLTPALLNDSNQLVVAHGSTLRALIKHLEQIPDDQIDGVEVGNAAPIVYTLDEQLRIVRKETLS